MKFYLVKTETCVKCRQLLPTFEDFAKRNPDVECEVICFGSSDKDDMVIKAGIQSVPALLVEKNGKVFPYPPLQTGTDFDYIKQIESEGK